MNFFFYKRKVINTPRAFTGILREVLSGDIFEMNRTVDKGYFFVRGQLKISTVDVFKEHCAETPICFVGVRSLVLVQ